MNLSTDDRGEADPLDEERLVALLTDAGLDQSGEHEWYAWMGLRSFANDPATPIHLGAVLQDYIELLEQAAFENESTELDTTAIFKGTVGDEESGDSIEPEEAD